MKRICLFVVLSLPYAAWAQSTFGTILGTVTDKSGAVVPGAKIVVANQNEIPREVTSDAQRNDEVLNPKRAFRVGVVLEVGHRSGHPYRPGNRKSIDVICQGLPPYGTGGSEV